MSAPIQLLAKKLFYLFLLPCCLISKSFAQSTHSSILPESEHQAVAAQLEENVKDMRRVYYLSDLSGDYQLALLEKTSKITNKDTLKSSIKAICFMEDHGGNLVKWELKDNLDKSAGEISIRFWTKYCTATDLDSDKRIDPVIVYGSEDESNYQRIKIITVYKGKKYAIRAVESEIDLGRSLTRDKDFNALPASIKTYLEKLMQRMRKDLGVLLKDN